MLHKTKIVGCSLVMNRVCLVLISLVFSFRAYAVTFTVSDIRLEGLQRVSASPVFAALSVRVGDSIDNEDIRQNIQSLFATGFFSNVQIARDGDVLIVILQERPAIKTVEIDGNKAIQTEQLLEILGDNDIQEGDILQRHRLNGIMRELERTYISQARYDASAEATVNDLPNNMVHIDIQIDEGSAATIRHINIVGNEKFSDEELLDRFDLTTAKWSTFFSSNDKYAKEKLSGDIEKLESFYLDQGYLDFSVVSSQISVSPDKKSVYITLNINEGDIYSVSTVDIGGDPILPEERVRRLILLRDGDTYSQARLDATSEYITTLLGNSGYTNAAVDGITEKNIEDKTVALTFFVNPGKRVYVRRIEFNGNTKTADNVLRREMRQMESSSASNARIEQSKVRLERLSYFKQVDVETKEVPGRDDLIDVAYTVEEQPSGSISASVGWAAYSGINLGVSIQQNNWMGSGKTVGFGVTKNIYQTKYNFNYTDPYFTPDGVSRGFSAYYSSIDTSRIQTYQPYTIDTLGAAVNFGYPISEISYLNFSLGLENQVITDNIFASQSIRQSPSLAENLRLEYIKQSDYYNLLNSGDYTVGDAFYLPTYPIEEYMLVDGEPGFLDKYGTEYNNAKGELSWSKSSLNRGVLATRGASQTLRLEATVPGSDMQFFKLHYDAQYFKPLNRLFTLRMSTSLGYGDGYGEMDELPFFENFYSGGWGSVRGFEQRTLGPKGTSAEQYTTQDSGWQDLNQDGDLDFGESFGSTYILCDDDSSGCELDQLETSTIYYNDGRGNASGGNVLVEFSTELLLPIPFIEDTRSMQLVAFVDAGNVFSTYCGEEQLNCYNIDLRELSSSAGFGFTWLSSFGPLTFSVAKALHESEYDERKVFQFTMGTGF